MTVLVARDGEHALSIVERVTPDVVLMDAVMPGTDGFETCRQLKQNKALAHVPVIFMTGLSDTEHIIKGLEAGGVDYVTKPIVPGELLARIRVHLANARMAHSARAALDVFGRFLLAASHTGACSGAPRRRQAARAAFAISTATAMCCRADVQDWLPQCAVAQPGVEPLSINVNARNSPTGVQLFYVGRSAPTSTCCGWSKARSATTADYSSKSSR